MMSVRRKNIIIITLITHITVQTIFDFGTNAGKKLFTSDDVKEIIELTKKLAA